MHNVTNDVGDLLTTSTIDIEAAANFTISPPAAPGTKRILWRIANTGATTIAVSAPSNFRFGLNVSGIPAIAPGATLYLSGIQCGIGGANGWDIVGTDTFTNS